MVLKINELRTWHDAGLRLPSRPMGAELSSSERMGWTHGHRDRRAFRQTAHALAIGCRGGPHTRRSNPSVPLVHRRCRLHGGPGLAGAERGPTRGFLRGGPGHRGAGAGANPMALGRRGCARRGAPGEGREHRARGRPHRRLEQPSARPGACGGPVGAGGADRSARGGPCRAGDGTPRTAGAGSQREARLRGQRDEDAGRGHPARADHRGDLPAHA